MNKLSLIAFTLLISLFTSCRDNEPCSDGPDCSPPILPTGPSDFLVINEGNFGQANGSISQIKRDLKSVTNDIVGKANNGITTGDVVQSIYHDSSGDRLFIISNVESRILVLNDSSFEQIGVMETDLEFPRYMLINDDRIYVTNWGFDYVSAFVSVFDRSTLSLRETISTDPGTEKIFTIDGNHIYVSNSFTNTVQVFEHKKSNTTRTIHVGNAPNGLAEVYGGFVNVICLDTFGGNQGYVYEIDNNSLTVSDSVPLALKPNGQLLSDASQLYFSSASSIYAFDPRTDFSASENWIINLDNLVTSVYGFSFDDGSSQSFWVADAKGFTENGMIHLVDKNDPEVFVESYEVGIGPNGFQFLNN